MIHPPCQKRAMRNNVVPRLPPFICVSLVRQCGWDCGENLKAHLGCAVPFTLFAGYSID